MKYLILFTIISGCLIRVSSGEDQNTEKETDKLIKKICKIARDKLHVPTFSPNDTIRALNTLKEKFSKAAKSNGFESSAYITLIVQGLTILVDDENYDKVCNAPESDVERRNVYKSLRLSSNFSVTDILSPNSTGFNKEYTINFTNSNETIKLLADPEMDRVLSNIDTILDKTVENSLISEKDKVDMLNIPQKNSEELEKNENSEVTTKQGEIRKPVENSPISENDEVDVLKIPQRSSEQLEKIKNGDVTAKQREILFDNKTYFTEKTEKLNKQNLSTKLSDTKLEQPVEKSPPPENEEEDILQTKQNKSEEHENSKRGQVITKQREVSADKTTEKHMSIKKTTTDMQENQENLSRKGWDIPIVSSSSNSEVVSLKNIAIYKGASNHMVKKKIVDERPNNIAKNRAEFTDNSKDTQSNKLLRAKPSKGKNVLKEKMKLFASMDLLIQKTINQSDVENMKQNLEKVKKQFLKKYIKYRGPKNKFVKILEKRFDYAINKNINSTYNQTLTQNVSQELPDNKDELLKLMTRQENHAIGYLRFGKNLNKNKKTKLHETVKDKQPNLPFNKRIDKLYLKIDTLINKTIDTSSTIDEQKLNVEKSKKQFLSRFKKARPDEKGFTELLKKYFDASIRKHFGRKMFDGGAAGERDILSINETDAENNKIINLNKSRVDEAQKSSIDRIGEEALRESKHLPFINETTNQSLATLQLLPHAPIDVDCNEYLAKACAVLRNLGEFTCASNLTITVSTILVCDGKSDCPDGSDERNCIQQVITNMHGATAVMSELERNRYCIKPLIDNSLLARQGDLLSSLLKTQIRFLEKYVKKPRKPPVDDLVASFERHNQEDQINTIVKEVGANLRSFGMTITSALCKKEDLPKELNNISKSHSVLVAWSPSLCECDGAYCANITHCDPRCDKLCYQLNTLTDFDCRSIQKDKNSISLNFVCDGKLDCFDEADEINCPKGEALTATTRSEASKVFRIIIHKIMEKAHNKDYEPVRVAMISFSNLLLHLQKLATGADPDLEQLKEQRNEIFSKLKDMYSVAVAEVKNEKIKEEAYTLLVYIAKQLIEVLKKTRFGNKRIVKDNECLCRGAQCVIAQCPAECVRECTVKDTLTRYPCSSSNVTIAVDDICNGKINCPKAEDEVNCKKDICRAHHIKMLRLSIHEVRDKYKDAIAGKALPLWATEVSAELEQLEKSETRPTPAILKQTVSKILDKLVTAYLTLEGKTFQQGPLLQKYLKVTTLVMESINSCNT